MLRFHGSSMRAAICLLYWRTAFAMPAFCAALSGGSEDATSSGAFSLSEPSIPADFSALDVLFVSSCCPRCRRRRGSAFRRLIQRVRIQPVC